MPPEASFAAVPASDVPSHAAPGGHGIPAPPPPPREPSPQASVHSVPRSSAQIARPGFNDLQQAAASHGIALHRAARGVFDQGKRGYYGDGSPAAFVRVVFDQARLPAPEGWGVPVYEQEAHKVLKRLDDPRAGDVAALYDARFKGQKGLKSYTQQVGSVEDPLVGIVSEYESKGKHKVRVFQVERGVPDEMSYRLDDLKSGRVVVSRRQPKVPRDKLTDRSTALVSNECRMNMTVKLDRCQ